MIDTFVVSLPDGIDLHCRASGPVNAPVLLFLHGYPEGAFIWDELLERFGDRYRCVAPSMRGYAPSSAPTDPKAYRAKHIVDDIRGLVKHLGGALEALIAHDWGGAVAWGVAAGFPELMKRLIIINSPHPAQFLRALQTDPAQQAASAYMNSNCEPGAEARLSADDFAQLWTSFTRTGAPWLTEAVKDQYRAVWRGGLTGPLNYYRASPLRPATSPDSLVRTLVLPDELVRINVPTHVIWGEADHALLPSLLDGLEAHVPKLTVTRVPGASHWIVHEKPRVVGDEIEAALSR